MTLFTDEEFGQRFAQALKDINDEGVSYTVNITSGDEGMPRASAIGGCIRKQYHRLLKLPVTDPQPPENVWSACMGAAAEQLVGLCLAKMGYEVVRVESDPAQFVYTSHHLDFEMRGLDLGDGEDDWTVVDSKLRNVFGFKQLLKEGPEPDMELQMQDYLAKRGRQRAMLVVVPHDLSTWRLELKKYKMEEQCPTPLVKRLWCFADGEKQALVEERARGLLTARELGLLVPREFDPALTKFPCGYCETRTHCFSDDLRLSTEPDLLYPIRGVHDE